MEAPTPTPTQFVKTIKIKDEDKKVNCKMQIIEDSIEFKIFTDNSLLYKGILLLEEIQTQINILIHYTIKEIFQQINLLDSSNFSIIKEKHETKLKILLFIILGKEFNLLIDLKENKNKNITNDELVNYYENIIKQKDEMILELKEIIRFKDEKIKALEEQLKNGNKNGIKKN